MLPVRVPPSGPRVLPSAAGGEDGRDEAWEALALCLLCSWLAVGCRLSLWRGASQTCVPGGMAGGVGSGPGAGGAQAALPEEQAWGSLTSLPTRLAALALLLPSCTLSLLWGWPSLRPRLPRGGPGARLLPSCRSGFPVVSLPPAASLRLSGPTGAAVTLSVAPLHGGAGLGQRLGMLAKFSSRRAPVPRSVPDKGHTHR